MSDIEVRTECRIGRRDKIHVHLHEQPGDRFVTLHLGSITMYLIRDTLPVLRAAVEEADAFLCEDDARITRMEDNVELKMWSVLCCDICWELEVVAPSPEAAKSITKKHFDGHLKCRTSKMVCEVIELDDNLQDVGARVLVSNPKGLSSRFRRKWKRIDK